MVDTPGAEAPSSPDITHVDPSSEQNWMGHPRQLARLFSVEMWERFGFYGMRALLVLYLVKHFLLQQYQASGIVGGYLSLVYLTPVIGGWLADYYLGSKRSVKWGALVMAAGYLLLCFGGDQAKPYATIGGQRYEVQVDRGASLLDSTDTKQWVVENGQRLQIHGMPDGSVQLLAPNGQVALDGRQGRFRAGSGEIAILSDFDAVRAQPDRDRQRLLQTEHLDDRRLSLQARRSATRRRIHDLLHGHQRRLDRLADPVSDLRQLVWLVGRFRDRRRRHVDRLCADAVRWRPARRAMASRRSAPARIGAADLHPVDHSPLRCSG